MADEIKSERITILLAPSELKELDDWSFDRRIRSRGEAIRQLLALGLEAAKEREQEAAKALRDEKPKKKAKGHPKDAAETADSGLDDDAVDEVRAPEVGEETDEAKK